MCSKYHVFFNIGLFLSNFKLYNPIFMISRLIASKDFLYTVNFSETFQEVSSRIFWTTSSGVIERVTCKYFSIITYSKYQLKYCNSAESIFSRKTLRSIVFASSSPAGSDNAYIALKRCLCQSRFK